jgi:predicted RNA-binding Zn ribbon-like protein
VFEFIADHPVLDFVATVAERTTANEEKLRSPADLADWVTQSGIVDHPPTITTRQLEHAKQLREALFALLSSLIDGSQPPPADRDLVNAAASRPGPTVQLSSSGEVSRYGDIDAVLAMLAADCLNLFDSADRQALHWCADPSCTRPFIDRSRGHRRRWCGMKGCGDRAKAAAYRARQREKIHASTA